jgi:hypothetical protein
MDVDDRVPEVVVHVGEGLVTQDTSVVHEDINATEGIDGGFDDGVTVLAGGLVANGLTAHLTDLLDDRLGVNQIVDDDGGAVLGEQKAVRAAETRWLLVRGF